MFQYSCCVFSLSLLIFLQNTYGWAASFSERKQQIIALESLLGPKEGSVPHGISQGTLSFYLQWGLRQNPQLQSAFYQWKAAMKKIPQAFSLPDPRISFTEYIDSVETRVGSQERAWTVQQKIPLPDKLWIRQSKAFKAAEAAYYRFEQTRLEIIYKITTLYYEYAYLYKAILLTQENMNLLRNFEKVAQSRYASGLTKNQDLLKVQVELGRLESELYSLQDKRSALMAGLNAVMNLPETTLLPWPKVDFKQIPSEKTSQEIELWMQRLKKDNPQLLSMDYRIKEYQDHLKLTQREYFPDVTVGFTHINTAPALNRSLPESGKDAKMLMFSINVPIWFHRINAQIQEAKASLRATESLRHHKEKELLSQLAFIHYQYTDAIRQSRLYKEGLIPKAMQTLNATKTGYEAGEVDFLSLIDAQRMLLNFQLAYYRYAADTRQKKALLNILIGESDPILEGEKSHVQ